MLERAGKEHHAPIWSAAAEMLSRPRSSAVQVNLSRVRHAAGDAEAVFVPGKVLGGGSVDRKLVVGAFSFSESARSKLKAAGGSPLSVEQFLARYPKGSGVRIVQ